MNPTASKSANPRSSSRAARCARWFIARGPLWQRLIRSAISLGIVLISVMPIARFIGVALQRLNYPFELEWIEGGSVGHIQVAMSGHQLYREPSFDFTPFIYPPLYYYVSALPSYVLGLGLLAPRLVSFASILGCFALLARWVRDETGDTAAGFAAAGLLAAVYQLTGLWMDLARVDSLFLFITLSANVLARSTHTVRRAALVGALLTASCFTKQLGIPLALPALVFLTLRSFRLGVVATLSAGATAALGALVFGLSSHGWIFYYLFQLPAHHEVEWSRLLPSMQTYFLGVTLPLTVAGLALLCGFGFPGKNWKEWIYSALFVFVGVTSSYLPYLKSGGYVNGLIPAYAALSLAAGIQLGNLRRRKREPTAMLGVVGPAVFTALLLAYQCAALAYDPNAALPTPADLAANEQALQRMKKLPQPLFVTASAHWNRISQEHGVPLHAGALGDVFKGGGPVARKLHADLAADLRAHRFATIVSDRAFAFLPPEIVGLIQQEYIPRGSVMAGVPDDVAWPRVGASIRPDTIWVARTPRVPRP